MPSIKTDIKQVIKVWVGNGLTSEQHCSNAHPASNPPHV